MAITILGDLSQNQVDLPEGFLEQWNGAIRLDGSGSRLSIKKARHVGHLDLGLRNNGTIDIDEDLFVHSLAIHAVGDGASIAVGKRAYFNGAVWLLSQEGAAIRVGNDCLFATGVELTCGDFHAIYDLKSGERINPATDIVIEDHVWLGTKVTVLKGAHVARDSVVGLGSIVTGEHPPNSVLAGVPARVIRSGVTWHI